MSRLSRINRRALLWGGLGLTGLGTFGGLNGAVHLANAAAEEAGTDRYFVFAYFRGGWDILLGLDPRDPAVFSDDLIQETRIQPAYDQLQGIANPQVLDVGVPGMQLGPYGGPIARWADRLTIVRGMSMETLTHEVGRRRFITGQAPQGLRARGSSIATHLAAGLGRDEAVPNLSAGVEAYNVDQPAWASALSVASVDDLVQALQPGDNTLPVGQRSRISALLAQVRECDATRRSALRTDAIDLREAGYDLVDRQLYSLFDFESDTPAVQELRERFNLGSNQIGAVLGAMASVALRNGISRVVSFAATSDLDTHFSNWRNQQGPRQAQGFQAISNLAADLDSHEYKDTGESWLDRTVIVGFSEFSRTPSSTGWAAGTTA